MTKKYEDYTREQLLEEIKKLKKQKKFGLVWEDKPEQVVEDCKNNFPVLTEVSDKAISEAENSPTHLIIEGDNFHSLSVLNVTHKGKIDVIYIDPPYNTGNKDFKYNDDFVDKEDSFRHSKWLSFMKKRLELSFQLLKDDGFLVASIDDNEVAQLKLLLDSLSRENTKIVAVKMSEASGLKMGATSKVKNIPKYKEYVIYAKPSGIKDLHFDKISKNEWDSEYNIYWENFTIENKNLINEISTKENILESDIEEIDNILSNIELKTVSSKLKELNITKEKEITGWLFENSWRILRTAASTSVKRLADEKRNKTKNSFFAVTSVRDKILYLVRADYSLDSKSPRVQFIFAEDNLKFHPGDFWNDIRTTGLEAEGGIEFKNGKKPLQLIERIIKSNENKSATILDFFAGSGTTGHAVLELNKEDGGNRQFILCTNNENAICEEVTYPRIKTVITGKRTDGTNYSDGIPANLRYFKTDFIEKSEDTDENRISLTKRCYELLQIKESCYESQKSNIESLKIWRSDNKLLAVIFDRYDKTDDQKYISEITGFARNSDDVVVYRFSIDGNLDMDISALKNARLEEIPEEILKTFNQIFKPKKKRK